MNPFRDTKEVVVSCIHKTMKQLAPISQKQYEKFVKDMADYHAPSSLNEPMTKDMLPLFRQKAKPNKSSAKNKLGSLKDG